MIRVGVEQRGHTRIERGNGAQDFIDVGAPIRVFGEHAVHERTNATAIVRGNRRHLLLTNLPDEIAQTRGLERVLEREQFVRKAS